MLVFVVILLRSFQPYCSNIFVWVTSQLAIDFCSVPNLSHYVNSSILLPYSGFQFSPVLPTPGKIIQPGHQKNSAAGRKNLPYPAAACMIIVDLCFLQQFRQYFGML
jgi:hypothetical protein